jgi:DNA-binding response OmpR family regulator
MTRILVIEDETAFQTVIKDALEKAGYEVGVASDGEVGLRLFAEQPYDVVITDILMPNKEGLETILELSEQSLDVKIIAISGGGIGLGDDLLEMAQDFGAQRALRKPITMKQLLEVVQEVLNESN